MKFQLYLKPVEEQQRSRRRGREYSIAVFGYGRNSGRFRIRFSLRRRLGDTDCFAVFNTFYRNESLLRTFWSYLYPFFSVIYVYFATRESEFALPPPERKAFVPEISSHVALWLARNETHGVAPPTARWMQKSIPLHSQGGHKNGTGHSHSGGTAMKSLM